MKRLLVICMAAMFAIAPVSAMAQTKAPADKAAETHTATGTVSAVAADSITIKAKSGELTFTIDSKTDVTGKGLTTKTAALKKEGKPTVITEFVKVGDSATIKYHDMGTTKHAASVRVVPAVVKK